MQIIDDENPDQNNPNVSSYIKTPVFNIRRKFDLSDKYELGKLIGKTDFFKERSN